MYFLLSGTCSFLQRWKRKDGGNCSSTSPWRLPVCFVLTGGAIPWVIYQADTSSWRRFQERCNSLQTKIKLQLQRCLPSLPSRPLISSKVAYLLAVEGQSHSVKFCCSERTMKINTPKLTDLSPQTLCICDVVLWTPFIVWAQNSIYWWKLCLH